MAQRAQSMSVSSVAVTTMLAAIITALIFGFCVVSVSAEVELIPGTKPLNRNDLKKFKDCSEVRRAGYNVSGVYTLHLNATKSFLVTCEFTKDNAFTVIQRRMDYTVNFLQPLDDYIRGFGYVQTNYWAGLDAINHLTMTGNTVLTINMQDSRGRNRNARYAHFLVQNNALKYQMTVAGFSGPGLLDDLSHSSGMPFHTFDYPDPNKCAIHMKAGWWYNYCAYTLLNGYFYPPGIYKPSDPYYDGVFWESLGGYNNSLKFVSMTVSPN